MTRSQKNRAENELIFKKRNDSIKNRVKELQSSYAETADIPLQFMCECANEDCTEPITMTVAEYEVARLNNREFIIKPGHEQTDIEKVVHHDGFVIVEKFEVPHLSDGTLNKTH
jgi:hypothetical protein